MAIKKLSQLPKGKRATVKQVEKARKAKVIQTKAKIIGSRHGRLEINLGTHSKDDVAGVIKGFRRKHRADFGAIIKDIDGNIIARTHTASGKTTIPEQLAVKALSKYGKTYDEVKIVLSAPRPKRKAAPKKAVKKKAVKKATKKAAKKKAVKKSTTKITKKGKRK